jgi:hypothetical protein
MPNFSHFGSEAWRGRIEAAWANTADRRFNIAAKLAIPQDTDHIALRPDPADTAAPHASFDAAAKAAHTLMSTEVEALIFDDKTPIDNAVPAMKNLAHDLLELRPMYQVMQEAGQNPEVVLAPRQLSPIGWSGIIACREVPYRLLSTDTGTYLDRSYHWPSERGQQFAATTAEVPTSAYFFEKYLPRNPVTANLESSESDQAEDDEECVPHPDGVPNWEFVLVSGRNGVAFTDVSPDAFYGREALWQVREQLKVGRGVNDEHFLNMVSPTTNTYIALQAQRLLEGRLPVDINSTTMLRERIRGKGGLSRTGLITWHVPTATIIEGAIDPHARARSIGIRPTVYARDLKYFD